MLKGIHCGELLRQCSETSYLDNLLVCLVINLYACHCLLYFSEDHVQVLVVCLDTGAREAQGSRGECKDKRIIAVGEGGGTNTDWEGGVDGALPAQHEAHAHAGGRAVRARHGT